MRRVRNNGKVAAIMEENGKDEDWWFQQAVLAAKARKAGREKIVQSANLHGWTRDSSPLRNKKDGSPVYSQGESCGKAGWSLELGLKRKVNDVGRFGADMIESIGEKAQGGRSQECLEEAAVGRPTAARRQEPSTIESIGVKVQGGRAQECLEVAAAGRPAAARRQELPASESTGVKVQGGRAQECLEEAAAGRPTAAQQQELLAVESAGERCRRRTSTRTSASGYCRRWKWSSLERGSRLRSRSHRESRSSSSMS